MSKVLPIQTIEWLYRKLAPHRLLLALKPTYFYQFEEVCQAVRVTLLTARSWAARLPSGEIGQFSMHELAVTQSLLDLALQKANARHARRVIELHLVIGRLASIVDDSVQFYFDELSAGTLCEQARLSFRRVPAGLECLHCGTAYTLDRDLKPCPQCGSASVRVTSGDEFYLESIEIEAPESLAV